MTTFDPFDLRLTRRSLLSAGVGLAWLGSMQGANAVGRFVRKRLPAGAAEAGQKTLAAPSGSSGSSCDGPAETIVLVHGLGRTRLSMQWLGRQFEAAGYEVLNIGYPSTRLTVEESAARVNSQLAKQLAGPGREGTRVHFVTHSLGAIVLRAGLRDYRPANLGRVVMLGPPNQGSEVADRLLRNWLYRRATGPAGQQLGTAPTSLPNSLGPVDYEVGVIAGSVSLNPLFSSWLQGPSDGKVSVQRAAVPGLRDLIVVARSHTFIMRYREVANQALHFIAHGKFQRPTS